MKPRHFLFVGVTAIFCSSCNTIPRKEELLGIRKIFTEAFALIYDICLLGRGSIDLLYCSASFRHKNDRWPENYAELSAFVEQSDGYLILGQYERVYLRPLPDDGLEICYVRRGHTIEMKLTLGAP